MNSITEDRKFQSKRAEEIVFSALAQGRVLNLHQICTQFPAVREERVWVALRRLWYAKNIFLWPDCRTRAKICDFTYSERRMMAHIFARGYRADIETFIDHSAFAFSCDPFTWEPYPGVLTAKWRKYQ